jgi:L-amino acid N-acyltransferase YncA
MTQRHEYSLELTDLDPDVSSPIATSLQLRPAYPSDAQALAELMIEAYRGTIDYDDETLEDAVGEIRAYLAGQRGGRPMLPESRLAFVGSSLISACLAGEWRDRQLPLIAYVMTHGQWKNRGVGRRLVWAVLQALQQQGHRQVRAVITEGNTPSERLFSRLGFRKVDV